PADRYDSAGALSDDLRRFLRGLPVEARRSMVWRRFRRPKPTHLAAAVLASFVLASLWVFAAEPVPRLFSPSSRQRVTPFPALRTAWAFSDGMLPPGSSTEGTVLVDFKEAGQSDGITLHFLDARESWLDVTFSTEDPLRASAPGRWILELVHHISN